MTGPAIEVRQTTGEDAEGLAELQRLVFPTLAPEERFNAEHYRHHVAMFPEGQWCAVAGAQVVGMTSTLRLDWPFGEAHPHRFADVIEGGWLTSHQPEGRWLYGADIGVHPQWRGQGIARRLYDARADLVGRLGLDGEVTVGMLSGYGAVRQELSAETYYEELCRGERRDPTVSMQMRVGFEPRGLLPDYVDDPVCAGYGVILVRGEPAAMDLGTGGG